MTTKRPAARLFTTTDANGVQLSFDPSSGRWTAEWKGKKTASLKYDVVRDKIVNWKTEAERAAAQTVPAEPVELTLLMVAAQDHQLKTTWRDGGELKIVPVQLKVLWDQDEGIPKILRYKPMEGTSGWKQFNADNLLLVDPFNLPSAQQALFIEHLRNRALRQVYCDTERTLASQWAGVKTASHHYVALEGGQLVPAQVLPAGPNRRDWRGVFSLGTQWPTIINVSPELKDTHAWESDAEGAWTQGDGSVRVKLHPSNWGAPVFMVEQRVENSWQDLLQHTSFEVALAVAEATLTMKDLEPIAEWTGMEDWAQRARGLALSWPKPVATIGALMVSKKTGEETLYMLQRTDPARAPHLVDNKPSVLQWVASNTSQYSSWAPASLWPVGPEDAVFPALAALNKAIGELQSTTGEVQTQLQGFTQETLGQAFGDATNGDAEKHTVEELQTRWDRLVERWSRQIAESDDLAQWEARCTAVVADSASLFSAAPTAKRHKP